MDSLIVKRISELVAISSVASNSTELRNAVEFIVAIIKEHPRLTVERFSSDGKPSLLAYYGNVRPKQFKVLLNAHVDVVPATKTQFVPHIEGNKLYGRGALDMKSAAVILTHVFCEQAAKVPYPLGLQVVSDEEVGGKDGTLHQITRGVDTEFFLAGEFTPMGEICNESRGVFWAELEFKGKTAHSAYLWQGENAILMGHSFIQRLKNELPIPSKSMWGTTANVATISTTNDVFNKVPDQVKIGIDIRYIAQDERFASKDSAINFLKKIAPEAKINVIEHEPAHFANPTNFYVKKLADAVEHTTKSPATFIQKHGSADIRFYSERGVPAVVFGVQGAGQHSDNEYADIDSFDYYKKTLEIFLTSLS